jgi:Domain of unknown function (DUF4440)
MSRILPLAALLLASLSLSSQSSPSFSGTWFGEIVIHSPDGKAMHDTAVLVFEQNGSSVTGTLGRTIDQQSPLTDGHIDGAQLRFHLAAAGGMDFVLNRELAAIDGTATGKGVTAELTARPAPGLVPHAQMLQEISDADRRMFDAFGSCNLEQYAQFLDRDLEFYQDRTGKTGYEQNLQMARDRCAEGIRLRREVVSDTLIVNAVPGYGAIESGTQRFFSRQPDGSERLDATAQFTNVWTKSSGQWKLTRVISFDHH